MTDSRTFVAYHEDFRCPFTLAAARSASASFADVAASAGRILIPHVKHSGASAALPWIASKSSVDECTCGGVAEVAVVGFPVDRLIDLLNCGRLRQRFHHCLRLPRSRLVVNRTNLRPGQHALGSEDSQRPSRVSVGRKSNARRRKM